jgi:hypothetical protein
MPHLRWFLAFLATGTGAMAAACGTSGYQYVENGELGVYAKLPGDWTMYDEEDLFASTGEEVSEMELENLSDRLWFRGFDAGDDPEVAEMLDLAGDEPRGFVAVEQLSVVQREQMNIMQMRGFSPLDLTGESAQRFQLISEEPVEFDGGYHGIHSVFTRVEEEGVATVDQTILLDSTGSTLYRFVVGCSQDCYSETHTDEIETIVDSWTIQEGG